MEQEVKTKPGAKNFNKPVYVIFLVAGTISLFSKDLSTTSIYW